MIKYFFTLILFFIYAPYLSASEVSKPLVYIDVDYIVNNSTASQDVKQRITKEVEKFQNDMQAKQKIISEQEQDLKSKAQVLSKEVILEKQQEIVAQFKVFESELASEKEQLDKKYNDFLLEIQTHIQKIVIEVAEKNNYQVVVSKSSVIYALQSLDISDEVVILLNKRVPKIELNN
jgi:outer membrane protein